MTTYENMIDNLAAKSMKLLDRWSQQYAGLSRPALSGVADAVAKVCFKRPASVADDVYCEVTRLMSKEQADLASAK